MDIIKTTPEALRAKAGQISDKGNEMKTTTDKMLDLVGSINGTVWSGQAQLAYTAQFNELDDDAHRMHTTTQELSQDLIDVATEYSRVEEETTAISQNLMTEVFF